MFALKRPCNNCPFSKWNALKYQLGETRVRGIIAGSAFPCHKTVDYDLSEDADETVFKTCGPQQCAGLMSTLQKAGKPNQIMQVAQRLSYARFDDIDGSDTFDTIADLINAHERGSRL